MIVVIMIVTIIYFIYFIPFSFLSPSLASHFVSFFPTFKSGEKVKQRTTVEHCACMHACISPNDRLK